MSLQWSPNIPLKTRKSGTISPYDFDGTFVRFNLQNDVSNSPECNRTLSKVVEEEKRHILMYHIFTTGSHGTMLS